MEVKLSRALYGCENYLRHQYVNIIHTQIENIVHVSKFSCHAIPPVDIAFLRQTFVRKFLKQFIYSKKY
ncbi:hypothetical protein RIR_jg5174.t1 [Rhizophagus irregularis DAOM 181602=DAOM 197198]|nr:hypothetical protein RIR_jg5174.t1 [Rhizophagus irregularis DAOM 181602=DAOM 197198]